MRIRHSLALPTLLCLIVACQAADNAVPNAGFEEVAGKAPKAWSLPGYDGCRFTVDETTAHTGTRSIRVDGLDPEKQNRFVQAWRVDVPLPEEGKVWFIGWAKGKDLGHGRLNVLHKDKAGKVLLNQGIGSLNGTFDWREFGQPLAQVKDAVSVQLVIGIQKSKGTIWFDDLYLGPRDVATGTLALSPSSQHTAGAILPAVFTFTVGEGGMQPGGQVALQWNNWRRSREFRILKPQVTCAAAGAKLTLTRPPRKKSWPPTPQPVDTVVKLTSDAPLPAGTEIQIPCQLRFSKHSNVTASIFGTIAAGAGRLSTRTEKILLEPQGGTATQLVCMAEPRPLVGKPGRVTVAVTDPAGNPADTFTGTVQFTPVPGMKLPASYTFTAEDTGSHDFPLVCPAGQVTRIAVQSGKLRAISNPVLPRSPEKPGIYFGDIHSHCEISGDGVGDPDQGYDYARRFHGLDFAGLSDHSPRNDKWKRVMEVGDRHNDPGRFVTVLGFEWSSGPFGHRNAYYPGAKGPEMPKLKSNMKPWFDWLAERNVEAVVIPHHTNTQAAQILASGRPAWEPCDWSVIDHRYQRLVEICQNRGSFEAPNGPDKELRILRKDVGASVQTALAMGHRLGFIGSTDTHSGRPGSGNARAAMVTMDFTRRGLWSALHDRSCYATTGSHTLVFFSVNGEPMGSELKAPADQPRRITWRAIGTSPIKRVDLLRNNQVVKSWTGTGDDMTGAFAHTARLDGTEWWYLRVLQKDTHIAWSSPIWIDPR
ncbi:MAG: CehA/McbA family metallohydrolase [Victivallales bacterium]|nr:CehA/McbA family metallohydrolase [Victivallales bacterium]